MRSQSGFRPYFVGPIIYHPSASVKNYSAWWIFRRRFSLLQGLGAPEYDQGFDCSETVLNRPGAPHQNTILLEMHGSPRWILDEPDWRGVVTKDWKYAFYDTGEELLFELNADPFEMTNLAEVQLDKKRELKSLLLDMLKESREPYFDVLMQHGVPPAGPVVDVSAIT